MAIAWSDLLMATVPRVAERYRPASDRAARVNDAMLAPGRSRIWA
jgi:hypothetical protein